MFLYLDMSVVARFWFASLREEKKNPEASCLVVNDIMICFCLSFSLCLDIHLLQLLSFRLRSVAVGFFLTLPMNKMHSESKHANTLPN